MSKVYTYPTVEHVQEVTSFKSKKYADGAIETLKWLDEGAPHKLDGLKGKFKFNMSEFVYNDGPSYEECGTACCIAGAIFSYVKRLDGNKEYDYCNLNGIFNVVDEDGQIKDYTLFNLFYARTSGSGNYYDLEKITPKQAAKTLQKYLKEGIVDWSHLED